MERADVTDTTLEYAVTGTGEPVMCIHGAFIADTFQPLLAEPSLSRRYQLITYHRRGYGGSSRAPGLTSIAQQAADCRALLAHLGVERAHVVGHSFGGASPCSSRWTPRRRPLAGPDRTGLMVGASAEAYREALARGGGASRGWRGRGRR